MNNTTEANYYLVDKLHNCIEERYRLTRLYFEARTNRMRSKVLALSTENNRRIRLYEDALNTLGITIPLENNP